LHLCSCRFFFIQVCDCPFLFLRSAFPRGGSLALRPDDHSLRWIIQLLSGGRKRFRPQSSAGDHNTLLLHCGSASGCISHPAGVGRHVKDAPRSGKRGAAALSGRTLFVRYQGEVTATAAWPARRRCIRGGSGSVPATWARGSWCPRGGRGESEPQRRGRRASGASGEAGTVPRQLRQEGRCVDAGWVVSAGVGGGHAWDAVRQLLLDF